MPNSATPDIDTVRDLFRRLSNWGRWGDADEIGTLNFVTPTSIVDASRLITSGRMISLAIPLGSDGPQRPGTGRFNPIHLMSVDGRDFMTGEGAADERDRQRRYLQSADGVIILPLQAGTQWDGLAHVFFEQKMYNGYSASRVTSSGARRNAITAAANKLMGRGILLDLPRTKGCPYLEPGYPITAEDLSRACKIEKVAINPGDFILIRTGAMARVRERGSWADYAGGDAPGLGLSTAQWFYERSVAGVAVDTWDIEVHPVETPDVEVPLHIVLIVSMGLWLGEIFNLEDLASACEQEGRYEFFLAAQPLPITGGVGSPINPIAIL
jgi:kynurenine formamidase